MIAPNIPQAAPHLRIRRYRQEVDAAIGRVIHNGKYVLGTEVAAFESAFAAYLGVRHCVGVNSGTDAIALALRAAGVGVGDEVITASMTAAGTGMAILSIGASPVFVDIEPTSRCIDPAFIESAITSRTKAIVPVHLHGQVADMARIVEVAKRRGVKIVEDCAQAHGATRDGRFAGSFGDVGAFSFYPTKNLGAIGDGGAVVTDDDAIAARVRGLRCYGWSDERHISRNIGLNSRLDEMQAAVLNVLLPHLSEANAERQAIAEQYRSLLDQVAEVELPSNDAGRVYHQFGFC